MKRFNLNEFIWFAILTMFSLYIYYLLSTGKIVLFIHPKMVKYAAFSFVVFGQLAVFQFFKVFTVKTRKSFKSGYLMFIFALAVGVFLAPGGLNSDIGNKKGVTLVSSGNIENIGKHTHDEEERISGDVITFNQKNYIHYLEDLSKNIDAHQGKVIKINGLVLKDRPDLDKDEFVVTRLLINCCAADSQVLGVICKWDKAETLEKDTWISIEGTVGYKLHIDKNSSVIGKYPVIKVNKLEKTKKPANPYIYE